MSTAALRCLGTQSYRAARLCWRGAWQRSGDSQTLPVELQLGDQVRAHVSKKRETRGASVSRDGPASPTCDTIAAYRNNKPHDSIGRKSALAAVDFVWNLVSRRIYIRKRMNKKALKCLLLLPQSPDYEGVARTLIEAGVDAGVEILLLDIPDIVPLAPHIAAQMTVSDFVLADISYPSSFIAYQLGVAHVIGKSVIYLQERGQSRPHIAFSGGQYLVYDRFGTTELKALGASFSRLIESYRNEPMRFLPPSQQLSTMSDVSIDLHRLSPVEFENLCFELLTQMGFMVQWVESAEGIDIAATLSQRDPDGSAFRQLWLVSMCRRSPEGAVGLMREPGILTKLLASLRDEELSELIRDPRTSITLLLIPFPGSRRLPDISLSRRTEFPVRLRIWDERDLSNVIQHYPQLAFKYFSADKDRPQASARKTPEELYSENVALTQNLQRTIAVLKEEQDKRARAERDAIWKEMSFKAAHKLGNPIFALETDVQNLKASLRDGQQCEALETASEMDVSLEKAKLIIEQFKSLTKAQEISPRPVEIVPIIQRACRVAQRNGVHVAIRNVGGTPKAFIDQDRVSECFDELVANSMHWFDKPPEITVGVTAPSPTEVPGTLSNGSRYLRILFTDNGVGIPSADKDRIFDIFYTTHPHGTGVGLALVRRIIEGHGGLIQEVGTPGVGCEFEMYLPATYVEPVKEK